MPLTVTGDNGSMASINEEVAAPLREYAELLGLTGGDPFRARNYEKAAKSVGGYPDDIGAIPDADLTRIPGVGSSIAAKIAEYRRTGTIKAVDDLRAKVPPGALLLAKVPGVGLRHLPRLGSDGKPASQRTFSMAFGTWRDALQMVTTKTKRDEPVLEEDETVPDEYLAPVLPGLRYLPNAQHNALRKLACTQIVRRQDPGRYEILGWLPIRDGSPQCFCRRSAAHAIRIYSSAELRHR